MKPFPLLLAGAAVAGFAGLVPAQNQPRPYDRLITNPIVDGSGRPSTTGSVAMRDGRIAAVGRASGTAARTIDARGKVVAPGFIDSHSHSDDALLTDGNAEAFAARPANSALLNQHAAFRVKGRVVNDRGEPIEKADVRLEAIYGYAAGTFAGVRTFSDQTNNKGDWSVGGLQPGVWLFEVIAPGYLPEAVVLPIRLLTTVSMGTSGMALNWDLILKPVPAPDGVAGEMLKQAAAAARDGRIEAVRDALRVVPEDSHSDYLAGAGRIAMVARDMPLARTLFMRALERDPSSYRAALGIASMFLLARDFDSASRAFDAARSRTHDKDEQRFLSIALGDLATITVR